MNIFKSSLLDDNLSIKYNDKKIIEHILIEFLKKYYKNHLFGDELIVLANFIINPSKDNIQFVHEYKNINDAVIYIAFEPLQHQQPSYKHDIFYLKITDKDCPGEERDYWNIYWGPQQNLLNWKTIINDR